MITRMYADVLFDREITNDHYISPGDFTVEDNNGNELHFGFQSSDSWVDSYNNRLLHIEQRCLDVNCFPNADKLEQFLDNLKCISQFYIFTGEPYEPEINPVKVIDMAFCGTDKDYYIKSEYLEHALDWVEE